MSIKGQSHYLILAKDHSEVKIKTCFLGNCWDIWKQISNESFCVNGNENLYERIESHDQDGRHAHIW